MKVAGLWLYGLSLLLFASGAFAGEHHHHAGSHSEIAALAHDVDQFLHAYHEKLEKMKGLKHFDEDFARHVHLLDQAVHSFHESLGKEGQTKEKEYSDFHKAETLYRESSSLFYGLAHTAHGDRDLGLGWKDFERKWEALHYAVTGHFSWQDAEMDRHDHGTEGHKH
jgi:hypothetical protein